MTTVSEAIARRRSVRVFLDKPVDVASVAELVQQAAQAPSGGNVQPWHVAILAGEPLAALKAAMAAGVPPQAPEYAIYPPGLAEPYKSRRGSNGEALYGSLGIPREDKLGRMTQLARNFQFFGAPIGLFLHTPKFMGPPQWADMGMWLQSLMLLLVEAGLASCPQEAWAAFPETVKQHAGIPGDHILFCGLAIGYPDPTAAINSFPNPRAPADEWLTILS